MHANGWALVVSRSMSKWANKARTQQYFKMQSHSQQMGGLMRQGWISLAAWIAFGILIEGLSGFRSPALLDDFIRRDMFRLAHAHGTLLNLVLIVAAICGRLDLIRIGSIASFGLRLAVVLLPVG